MFLGRLFRSVLRYMMVRSRSLAFEYLMEILVPKAVEIPPLPFDAYRICIFERWRTGELIFVSTALTYGTSFSVSRYPRRNNRSIFRLRRYGFPNHRILGEISTYSPCPRQIEPSQHDSSRCHHIFPSARQWPPPFGFL